MTQNKRRYGGGSVTQYTVQNKTRKIKKWRYQLWEPVDYTNPQGEKKLTGKSGFITAKEAEKALSEHRRRIENMQPLSQKKITVSEYAVQWIESLRLANSTLAGYRKILRNQIEPRLGNIELAKLTPTQINAHYSYLLKSGSVAPGHIGEPLSANSVKKAHDLLASMLDSAVVDTYLNVNPARHPAVKPPRAKEINAAKPEITVWDKDQLNNFLAWNEQQGDDLNALWALAAHTGLRRGELLALQWGDIDLKRGKLAVRRAVDNNAAKGATKLPKSGKVRVVDLLPSDIQVMGQYRELRARISFTFIRSEALIFGTVDDNHMRLGDNVSVRFRKQVRKAQEEALPDLPFIHFHELRHTHATQLLQAGVQPKVVQERLGHSTISITLDIYSHVMPSMQSEAVQRLGELLA